MKKIKSLICIMLLMVIITCSGCVRVFVDDNDFIDAIESQGPLKKVEYQVGDYSGVEVAIAVWDSRYNKNLDQSLFPELIYSSQKSDTVTIEMPEDMEQYISVTVKDGILVIKADKQFKITKDQHPKIYISTPKLEKLVVRESLQIQTADIITADSLMVDVEGTCVMRLSLSVKELQMNIGGAGELYLDGTAQKALYSLDGAATAEAADLETWDTEIRISGAGSMSVYAQKSLDVNIAGTASVTYRGEPVVTQTVSGLGSVEKE